jgi:tape measure domain-containing protein
MSSIDERVVAMKFDNAQFTRGVSETNQSLEKLKQGLNLDASAKSLQGLQDAGSRFSLAGMAKSVQDLGSKFTALSIVGITALTNITNKAVDAGMRFAQSFTTAPIKAGFDEYELKIGSIQTILANTARHGTTLETITSEFEKLNEYSDKTIYNFGDMTRNIGLFTASGIKVEDATTMIKGFSNAAATTGTSAEKASGAAYQLSQALGDGKITLETWNSLSNAGMGNKNMQEGLINIAQAMGKFTGTGTTATEAAKTFNKSLEKGWLAPEVMSNYLKIMSGDMDDAAIAALGLNDAQVKAFRSEAQMGLDAAQKIRTFTQLVGTLQETVGSSWATTFELLIGNFTEATALWTNVNDTLGGLIGKAGKARNDLIKGWVEQGGRKELIEAISSAFNSLMSVMGAVGRAWKEVFPPITVDTLTSITGKISNFLKALKPGEQTLANIQRTFKGLFAVLDLGWFAVQLLWGVFERLFKGMSGAGGGLLGLTARFGDFLVKIHDTIINSDKLNAFFVGLTPLLQMPGKALSWLIDILTKFWDKLMSFDLGKIKLDFGPFGQAVDNLMQSLAKLRPTGEGIKALWEGLINVFKKALEIGQKMAGALGEAFKGIGSGMQDATKGVDFNTILGILGVGVGGAGFMGIIKVIKKFKDGVVDAIESIGQGGGLMDTIKEAFGGLTETLSNMQQTLKASTLILLAGAIALLAGAMMTLSKIDAAKLPAVLAAMTVMFVQLSTALAVLDKMTIGASVGKMAAIGAAMILLSIAIKILASAMEDLSKLSWDEIIKGLVAVTGMLLGLSVATRIMGTQNGSMIQTGIGLMAVAVAVKILASAVGDFAGMDWQKMMQGLIGVGAVLGGLALFTRLAKVNKGAMGMGAGLILLGVAIKILASAVGDFASMDAGKIQQGLGALTAVLAMLAIFSRVVNPTQMVSMGVAMVILGGAMKILANAISDMGNMPWDVLARGLAGMAVALVAIVAATRKMPKDMLAKAAALVVVAAALEVLADVLKKMGGMSIEEIAKGLGTLGIGLMLISTALMTMEKALPGAYALIVASGALVLLATALTMLGGMSIEQLVLSLATLAAALTILGLAALILTPVIPELMALGIAVGILGAGAALAGIGMLAFAAGLTILAAAGAGAATVLIAVVTGLLGLLPYAFTQVGLAIVALAQVLGNNVGVFINLGIALITGLLDGIKQIAPVVLNFIADMLFLLLDMIANNIQRFVDAGVRIIVGFINGIAGQIGNVVNAIVNLIVNLLNAIANNITRVQEAGTNVIIAFITGIGRQASRLAQAGYDTIINFVNSLADTIRGNQGRMNSAGSNLAGAIIDGMTSGIRNGISAVANAARNVAQGALDTVKSWLGIHSPSREFKKLGQYSSEGLAIGISDKGDLVDAASEGVARSALDTMADTLARLDKEMDDHMALNPVITPVLDLSAMKADAATIGGLVTPPPLDLTTSYARASALVAAARAASTPTDDGSDPSGSAGGEKKLVFIQNNYSPKAISAADSYRNTKSQISRAKGELVK